jgi:hypothetical protein
MASRPPPRFVVRSLDAPNDKRRLLWLAGAWLVSLFVVALLSAWLNGHASPEASDRSQLRRVSGQNDELLQQVANLQRSEQVSKIAANELKSTLGEREEEISGLRTDLAFYSRLVGGAAQREGLNLQDVRLTPVAGSPQAWNFVLTLTQNAKRGSEIKGKASIAVEGVRGDKVVVLEGNALGDAAQASGVAFSFKYFEQVQGTVVLPADFKPTRLRIRIDTDGNDDTSSTVAWADATKKTSGESHVQQ